MAAKGAPMRALPLAVVALCGLLWISGHGWTTLSLAPVSSRPNAIFRSAADDELVFLSLGDWGTGSKPQRAVAAAMAQVAAAVRPDFIVSLGDNFYDSGVDSTRDPLWVKYYEEVYDSSALRVPWYAVLGDHDHKASVRAQIDYGRVSDRWHMPAPYYTFNKGGGARPRVKFLMLDSLGLEGGFVHTGEERRYEKLLDPQYTGRTAAEQQISWVDEELAEVRKAGRFDWVVAVGHRPALTAGVRDRTASDNRTARALRNALQHSGVDVYMNGHDHTMQVLRDVSDPSLHFIVNGGGGQPTLHKVVPGHENLLYGAPFWGFCLHRVNASHFSTDFIDTNGTVRHRIAIARTTRQASEHTRLASLLDADV